MPSTLERGIETEGRIVLRWVKPRSAPKHTKQPCKPLILYPLSMVFMTARTATDRDQIPRNR